MSKQNLTRIVGIWWGLMLGMWCVVGLAQDITLQVDTPVTVMVGYDPVWLTYSGTSGEVIQIATLTAITDTAPDTTLEILYPDGQRLDYADDVMSADGTIKTNAVIQNLTLSIDGVYRVRVDSFNGVSEGEVEVVLSHPTDTYEAITTGALTIIRGEITENDILQYPMSIAGATTLTIVARDVSGTLDPVLSVYDGEGHLLAFNDDHRSNELSLDVLDARITSLAISENTRLNIVVQDFLGRYGTVELIISS